MIEFFNRNKCFFTILLAFLVLVDILLTSVSTMTDSLLRELRSRGGGLCVAHGGVSEIAISLRIPSLNLKAFEDTKATCNDGKVMELKKEH